MFGLGMGEGLIILAVVVLLFGGKKLPQLGSAMGKSLTNFKTGLKSNSKDENENEEITKTESEKNSKDT